MIAFNIDDAAGLVATYLKENGCTFPVLLAHDLVHGLFDVIGIPQNWILDAGGKWVATQLGFDAAGKWERQGVPQHGRSGDERSLRLDRRS